MQNLARWETAMITGLTTLRDAAEKRLLPALQRLLIVLQDARGWSLLCVRSHCSWHILIEVQTGALRPL